MNSDSVYLTEAVPSGTVQTALPCKRCGGTMLPGRALAQTVHCSDEGTCSPGGPGRLIDCLKCIKCGWSVTAGTREEGTR